jgi:calcineurin-like phosphoesterase family protein
LTNIWLTGDTHFSHDNIRRYCSRPFNSVNEMDDFLIKSWNNLIKPGDIVYHVGDFVLGNIEMFARYANVLNGFINILEGNHDHRWWNDFDIFRFPHIRQLPSIWNIDSGLKNGKYSIPIILSHFPLLSWDRSFHGSFHAFGHEHGTLKHPNHHAWDVGVDNNNYKPISLNEFLNKVKDK